jgi:hypothetical protein
MPLAILTGKPEITANQERMRRIAEQTVATVATFLDCTDPGGDLTPNDIEAEVRTTGPMDVGSLDLTLTVFANDFPTRRESLDTRKDGIAKAFSVLLQVEGFSGIRVGVWVLLCPAAWSDFTV